MPRYKNSKEPVPVEVYFREEGDDLIALIPEEIQFGDNGELPEGVIKEVSYWQEPSFGMQQLVNENSRREGPDGTPIFDIYRFIEAQFRFLMKGWSLENSDPSLTVKTVAVPNTNPAAGVTMLADESMAVIRGVRSSIVMAFYRASQQKLYPATASNSNAVMQSLLAESTTSES